MEPIINPMFFYWLSVVNSLNVLSITLAIATTFCSAIACLFMCIEEEFKVAFKTLKIIMPIIFIFTLMGIFIPTKSTLIEMEVARNITHDRLDKIVEVGNDLKNSLKSDVIAIIKAINTKEEE